MLLLPSRFKIRNIKIIVPRNPFTYTVFHVLPHSTNRNLFLSTDCYST